MDIDLGLPTFDDALVEHVASFLDRVNTPRPVSPYGSGCIVGPITDTDTNNEGA